MQHLVSFPVLIFFWCGKESWLLCFDCFPDVLWPSVFRGSFPWWRGMVCGVWFRYFLAILTSLQAREGIIFLHELILVVLFGGHFGLCNIDIKLIGKIIITSMPSKLC